MEVRTGIDMESIQRIEQSLENARFLLRFFGAEERRQFEEKGRKASFIAGNFCAKEAFSKALGTGIRGFELREVEVLRNGLGKPYFRFSGAARELVEAKGLSLDVSISHTTEYAVASVVAWMEDSGKEKAEGCNNLAK